MTSSYLIVWDEGLVEREATTSEVDAALRLVDALDGRERTLVTIYRDGGHIAVGGSAVAGLVVYVTFDGQSFHQLRSGVSSAPADDDDEVAVVAGGQAGNYRRRFVLDAGAAKAATSSFILEGGLDPGQVWETS